ncbi:MAG: DUF6160 family protein [Moraxellaceae bacterium]
MKFAKLLLVSAISLSSSAFAMESLDDTSLSAATGQDGLDISLATKLGFDLYIHDTDGFTGATAYTDSGAIVMRGVAVDNGAGANAGIAIKIDAGATGAATNDAILNVGVSTTTTTRINLGTLRVANSARPNASTSGTGAWGLTASTETGVLMNLGSLSFAATTDVLKIQMGHEETGGAWIRAKTAFTGGLSITGFSLNDAGGATTGGGIGGDLSIFDTGSTTTLNADLKIDADTTGLKVNIAQLGTAAGGMDVRLASLKLGNIAGATRVGDVEVIGLNLNNTVITIAGH